LTDNRIFEHYTAGRGGTVYYGDNEVTRLNRIYDWATVPQQSRRFDVPVTVLQGIEVGGTGVGDAVKKTASDARGVVFADGQSRMVYQNRRHRYNRPVRKVFAESLISAPEMTVTFTTDDAYVFNDIRGSRPFGGSVRMVNALSKATYGLKVASAELAIVDG